MGVGCRHFESNRGTSSAAATWSKAGGEPRIDDAVLIRPDFDVIEIKRREDSNAGVLIGVSSRAVCRVECRVDHQWLEHDMIAISTG